MYEQRLPIEEWKAKKQAELKETIAAQKSILQEVVQDGQRLADYLYGRGRLGSHITSGNAALVLQTLPQARAVLTAKDWDKFGRRVNKGAKGIPQLMRVNGMDIMLNVFSICNGIVTDMADSMGGISEAMVSLPAEMQTAIENVGFLASIPLWLVTILGSLFITVLSFVMILTVYGRFFRLYMYTALAPLPLAAFAGESTQSVGISFLKSYVGVCLEGAVIVLACVIYSAFVSTPTVASGEATTIVWSYLAETVFNMLVLVGLIKGSDRIIHEMMGL